MTTLPSRVPGYTTNLTTPKVKVVLELGRWRGMPKVVMPEVMAARARSVELVDNARAKCQVGPMTVETDYDSCCHGCAIDNGKKDQPR